MVQRVDNYEYELPADFEDEEIDEETAFTEADRKQFADWFADEPEGTVTSTHPNLQSGILVSIQETCLPYCSVLHISNPLLTPQGPYTDACRYFADDDEQSDEAEADLLASESEGSEEEELNADDFSEDVSMLAYAF